MREIKFRGYAMDEMVDSQWIYGTGILVSELADDYAEQVGIKEEVLLFTESGWVMVYKESVGQFTGLHDKNGKEIYEGDILELINASGRRILAICKFGSRRLTTENGDMIDIQCFYFEVEGRKTNPMVCNYKAVHDLEIMKVIGNIFDNLELLESEE